MIRWRSSGGALTRGETASPGQLDDEDDNDDAPRFLQNTSCTPTTVRNDRFFLGSLWASPNWRWNQYLVLLLLLCCCAGAYTRSFLLLGSILPSSSETRPVLPQHQIQLQNNKNDDKATILQARIFTPWPKDKALPCFQTDVDLFDVRLLDTTPAQVGFLYQKTQKCASTTTSGVALRIARNVAKRQRQQQQQQQQQKYMEMCDNRWSHGKEHSKEMPGLYATRFQHRDPTKSFLWTMVREPTHRYISHYYFGAVTGSRKKKNNAVTGEAVHVEPSLASFQSFVAKWPLRFYNCVLSTQRSYDCLADEQEKKKEQSPRTNESILVHELNQILNEQYDFIGITERYDESLVVLMMLLNLKLADILYWSSKTSGKSFISKGAVGGKNKKKQPECFAIPSTSNLPKDLVEYLENSPEWQARVYYDNLLHQAVNRSLDLTIDRLGRRQVQNNVARFRRAQEVATEHCQGRIVLPCDKQGMPKRPDNETDCYILDIGCGMECLDEVATELDLW